MTTTPTSAEPQAGDTGGTPPAQAATTPTPQAGSGKTPEDYERMLADLRKENAGHRTKLKTFEDAQQAAKDAQLSEIEKTNKLYTEQQARNEALMAEILEQRVYQSVAQAASKLNFVIPPDLIVRMLEWDEEKPDHIEFDEESGKPTNIEKLLAKLAKDAPDLVKAQATAPGTPMLPGMNPSRSGRTDIPSPSGVNPRPATGNQYTGPRLDAPGLWKR